MSDIAWLQKRVFPFIPGSLEDLDGSSNERGAMGFGTAPDYACAPRGIAKGSKNTGWQPIIKGLGYVTLNEERVHEVRIRFAEQVIPPGEASGGDDIVPPQKWSQVIFDELGVRFVYLVNIPVPVSETNGNPFGLQIITNGRLDPSSIVVDWAWARFVLDISASTQAKLLGRWGAQMLDAGRKLVDGLKGSADG